MHTRSNHHPKSDGEMEKREGGREKGEEREREGLSHFTKNPVPVSRSFSLSSIKKNYYYLQGCYNEVCVLPFPLLAPDLALESNRERGQTMSRDRHVGLRRSEEEHS